MLLFATTVFLSAFLLFQIQPIVAKMILPWFGGSSSVWSVCMVFFQVELLLGYAYVHWLNEKLTTRRQMWTHGSLLLLSLLTLPVAANPAWRDPILQHPGWNVLLVLATAVGAPYLLLSTTGPLMQAWYTRVTLCSSQGAQPYRLYALSNLASMLGLLTYPVFVEPLWPVGTQAKIWSWGFAAFVLSCLGTMVYTLLHGTQAATQPTLNFCNAPPRPTWRECILWIGLAATPSILLLAITRHLTQDVAPVPFLWVLPLSIYLFSFILCFDAPRYYIRSLFVCALPLGLLTLDVVQNHGMHVAWLITLMCLALFVFCMVCHGELVRRRPALQHLTLFYLMLSIGGAVGGLLVGLVAPAVFTGYFELPIGLFLCATLVALVVTPGLRPVWQGVLLLALLGYGWRLADQSLETVQGYRKVVRNFYSQTRVVDTQYDKIGPVRLMRHGSISHGEQYMAPQHQQKATAYYCEESSIGRAIRCLQSGGPVKIGIIGLGTGTLSAYGRPGDELRMYEINEQVLDLAQSEFTFLQNTAAKVNHVLGDGRLMLEAETPQNFDLLVMDAFSGDSIPTHLLTLEAMRGYLKHLKPEEGILAVHITNTYLDLRPVMAATAEHLGMVALMYEIKNNDLDIYCRRCTWVLMMTPERASRLPEPLQGGVTLTPRPGFRPWTDSFSNLLSVLK